MKDDTYTVGDWVQATRSIIEEGFFDSDGVEHLRWEHAARGALGHVVDFEEGFPIVFFERSKTTTLVDPAEVKFLCHAQGPEATKAANQISSVLHEMLLTKQAMATALEKHKPRHWEVTLEQVKREIEALDSAERYVLRSPL